MGFSLPTQSLNTKTILVIWFHVIFFSILRGSWLRGAIKGIICSAGSGDHVWCCQEFQCLSSPLLTRCNTFYIHKLKLFIYYSKFVMISAICLLLFWTTISISQWLLIILCSKVTLLVMLRIIFVPGKEPKLVACMASSLFTLLSPQAQLVSLSISFLSNLHL